MDGEEYPPESAKPYLQSTRQYEKDFSLWTTRSDRIDKIYASLMSLDGGFRDVTGTFTDQEFDLFWASMEVVKPSIYCRPPVPVVTPKFKDRSPVKRITADLLERSAISGFEVTDIDAVMIDVRDDLVLSNRGVLWVSYEDDGDREEVCIEQVERSDFAHGPGRKWREVSWVQKRAWLTMKEMKERFSDTSGDLYLSANYTKKTDDTTISEDHEGKAGVWERWDKVENKVTWFTDGCDDVLDQDEPHLKLRGKLPCPRPAYGTRRPHSLEPVPDLVRIESQLDTINMLTRRIHDLCDKLVVKGIIPAGTDTGDAVEAAFREENAAHMLIPVPSMSLTAGAGKLVEWLPIEQVAQAILASVEARRELIGNVQELLGIADIMRGDSEANETFGAQKLKAQYGSVRIRDRVTEMVRIARDALCIMSEIMAEEFDLDTLLKMAQMELPTNAEVKRQLKDIEKAARQELEALTQQAEMALADGAAQQDPQAAQQQLQQAQQQIIAKYQPQIQKLSQAVTKEMVQELLDDTKTDPFIFDIETDSTIYPDELAEKQARAEFMVAFGTAMQTLMPMVQSGGAEAAGEILKWSLAPFRPDRAVLMALDEYVKKLESAPPASNPDAEKNAAEAKYKEGMLAIEGQKLQQDGAYKQAEIGLREQELQLKAQEIQSKPQTELGKEQIKAQAHLQERTQDAEVAIMREQAQLNADTQTNLQTLEAEAALAAQEQMAEDARFAAEQQFKREELAIDTQLEWARLDQQAEDARANRMAAAMKPKGDGNA
jgi:hypothetical protein